MKKSLLILALAMVFTFAITSMAMAAQKLDPNANTSDSIVDYLDTPEVYTGDGSASNYPDGIYIPQNNNATIHSAYQKNTDACAACHATHTAVGANALLQWKTNQDTCDACHDGTVTSIYDVEDGQIASTGAMTFGGLFGAPTADDKANNAGSLSRHNVLRAGQSTGSPIAGLPGGASSAVQDSKGTWEGQFTCVSCHDPHGKLGNFRILSPNTNGFADVNKVTKEPLTLNATDGLYHAAKGNFMTGHGYDAVIYNNDTAITTGYTLDPVAGTVKINDATLTGPFTMDYSPGLIVKGTVTNKLQINEDVQYTSGMSNFCGACHVDYNAARADDPIVVPFGTYTKAYRHPMGPTVRTTAIKAENGKLSCLGCHVAHGANETWWASWKTRSGWTGTVNAEEAGSSALKRLPNMATCEACHAKGDAWNPKPVTK